MQVITQSIDGKIIRSIKARKGALAFSAKDFWHLGNRPAVGQGLARLVKQGQLRRVRQGIYDLPRAHPLLGQTVPDPIAVIRALMDGSGAQWQASGAYAANLLGLSDQVPAKIVILTDGPPRRSPAPRTRFKARRNLSACPRRSVRLEERSACGPAAGGPQTAEAKKRRYSHFAFASSWALGYGCGR